MIAADHLIIAVPAKHCLVAAIEPAGLKWVCDLSSELSAVCKVFKRRESFSP